MEIDKIRIHNRVMKTKKKPQLMKKAKKRKKNHLMKIKFQKLKVKVIQIKMNKKVNMKKWKKIKNHIFNN